MSDDTIYDHPLYYDILFGWDRSREAECMDALLRARGHAPGDRLCEVACGTGQLARRLARRGWRLAGFDTRPAMLAFLRAEAAREGLQVETFEADMASVTGVEPFTAAINPMSSLRLLHSDALLAAHLRAMSALLVPGGSYVLDLEIAADAHEAPHTTDEAWEMERDGVTVTADDEGVTVRDGSTVRRLRWGEDGHLRVLTADALERCIASVDGLATLRWHPETGREDDVSAFDLEGTDVAPVGRTLLVLERGDAPVAAGTEGG